VISISRVTATEIPDIEELVHQYREFYKQPRAENTKQFLTDRIKAEEAIVFVANYVEELNVRAVGFALCYPTYSTVSLSPIWLLNDLFVDARYRGHGIANSLMDRVETAARESGATRVFLRTAEDNVAAQALYEKRGWIQDVTFRRYDLVFSL
jgi:ribosomal protein S18 acetylase RimI-like enzyme